MKRIYVLSMLGLLLQACNQAPQQQAPSAMPYPVVSVPTKTVTAYQSYPASIEGTNTSAVRAKISGYITQVLVDEGQAVRKGQPLFRLETESLSQEAAAAKANMNAAQVEVDKLSPLVAQNIISSVQLETAKARLAQAKSAYNSVMANIGYATIKSPINGYIGAIPHRVGALVSPADPQPLTTVSTTDDVFVFFAMNEANYLSFLHTTEGTTRAEKVKMFPKVQLELINGTIYDTEGTIETVTGQVDPTTGTVSFRARFANPTEILANGSSGKIRIPTVYENKVVVPESATFERQGKVYVFTVGEDNTVANTPIDILDRVEGYVVVSGGLEAGTNIVAQGVAKLRNQMPIAPQMVAFDSIAKPVSPVFK